MRSVSARTYLRVGLEEQAEASLAQAQSLVFEDPQTLEGTLAALSKQDAGGVSAYPE